MVNCLIMIKCKINIFGQMFLKLNIDGISAAYEHIYFYHFLKKC